MNAEMIEGVLLSPWGPELEAKHDALTASLESLDRVIVAYSGGVDSAFLLAVAHRVLGPKARAFTARSPSMMQIELEDAIRLAGDLGVEHIIVDTHELDRPGYVENSPSRCYHCKAELFTATSAHRALFEGAVVVDGFNRDDLSDFRPGHRAAEEQGVRHPLAEVGLGKAEIRTLSRRMELRTWNKPQLACMSSRIPHGTSVTRERLERIEAVETALRRLGFFDVRARLVPDQDEILRLELGSTELERAVRPEIRAEIVSAAHAAGFGFVTLDLEGFRSGRMVEGLSDRLVHLGRRGS